MKQDFYVRIREVYFKYWDEMCAEMAWYDHAPHFYAPEHLAGITKEVISLLSEYLKKVPACYTVEPVLRRLADVDFDGLIVKVYEANNLTENEQHDLAKILNDAFKDRLKACFGTLNEIYKEGTGESLDYALDKAGVNFVDKD